MKLDARLSLGSVGLSGELDLRISLEKRNSVGLHRISLTVSELPFNMEGGIC